MNWFLYGRELRHERLKRDYETDSIVFRGINFFFVEATSDTGL